MSDYDPDERSTDLDGHGLAPAVEPDRCAQSGGHGMEEVRVSVGVRRSAPLPCRWSWWSRPRYLSLDILTRAQTIHTTDQEVTHPVLQALTA